MEYTEARIQTLLSLQSLGCSMDEATIQLIDWIWLHFEKTYRWPTKLKVDVDGPLLQSDTTVAQLWSQQGKPADKLTDTTLLTLPLATIYRRLTCTQSEYPFALTDMWNLYLSLIDACKMPLKASPHDALVTWNQVLASYTQRFSDQQLTMRSIVFFCYAISDVEEPAIIRSYYANPIATAKGKDNWKACILDTCRYFLHVHTYEDYCLAQQRWRQDRKPPEAQPNSKTCRAFIVHGHNLNMVKEVASCLREHQIDPIILQDEPAGGMTIIEKFEAEAHASDLAVVLLSADDLGAARRDIAFSPHTIDPARISTPWSYRARQNVMLELGYFMAKLQRRTHLCLVVEPGVELPSDIHGMSFVTYESGWEERLAREVVRMREEVHL